MTPLGNLKYLHQKANALQEWHINSVDVVAWVSIKAALESIPVLESTITTQSAALRLAVEAFGPLGVDQYFCFKCGAHTPKEFNPSGSATCVCGYWMPTINPKEHHVAALTACREALREDNDEL